MDGCLDAARVLLEFNADVNECDGGYRLTPLHYATFAVRACVYILGKILIGFRVAGVMVAGGLRVVLR